MRNGRSASITRIDDTHFSVINGGTTLTAVQYVTAHGAPAWYWDDNGRKGAFAVLDWTADKRTNAEVARLAAITDCSSHTPPVGSPGANYNYSAWHQTQYELSTGLEYVPCCPIVIAITPNGESWSHGRVIGFPGSFTFDHRYGAMWFAEVEQAMAELSWQSPHRPCGLDPMIQWVMDGGNCSTDSNVFAHYPLVEGRVSLPTNGGPGQNETAPMPPEGIGYLSPVSNAGGIQPPTVTGFASNTGNPYPVFTAWGYRQIIEGACAGCVFNYVSDENLPCVTSPGSTINLSAPALTGLGGLA